MKFRNLNTGEVFEDISAIFFKFCRGRECDPDDKENAVCPFHLKGSSLACEAYAMNNPEESARLMGYEVISEEQMMDLPLDIGSMTLAQSKEYCRNYRHNCIGRCEEVGTCELRNRHICGDWTHEWETVRYRLTPEELEICRLIGAKWISKDEFDGANVVDLWKQKPNGEKDGSMYVYRNTDGFQIASISDSLFLSVKPGDCICVEDLIKEATNGT